jgi:phospholipase/carboxylesterase
VITVLAFHGASRDEADLVPFSERIAPRARVIAPRGTLSQGTGYTFFRRLSDGSVPSAEVIDGAEWWLSNNLAAELAADGAVIAIGYSSGAIFAEALLAAVPDRFAGAILLRPEPLCAEFRFPTMTGKPILILAGRHDERRRPDDAARLAAQFRAAGAEVTLHILDTGHDWAPDDEDALLARSWLTNAMSR